jgi:hypothetical protein
MTRFFMPAFTGDSLLVTVICLSQSDYNGPETRFSLKFGQRFADLAPKKVLK